MRKIHLLSILLLVLLLSGCAAEQAYKDGQHLFDSGKVEEGLAQMDKASRLEPDDSEYRSQYYKKRESAVYQWLSKAEAAKAKGAWDEAEGYYRRILRIDPVNQRAQSGLGTLNTEKKQAVLLEEANALLTKEDMSGAAKKVRLVLVESPSNPAAIKLQKAIESRMMQARQASGLAIKSKLTRPITIEFKDAPIQAVFEAISKTAGINFIYDKEVRPDLRVNLFVRDARIEDVIRFVLVTNQLGQRVLNENTLFIYPNTPQKQKDFQELQVKNFYLTNADAKDVAAMLKSMVKARDLYVDEKLNRIVMRDTPEAIKVAERLVAAQDMAEPEVMLEVEVLEVGTNALDTIGVQYPSQISYSMVGAAGTPGTATLQELINRNAGLVRVSLSDPALVVNLLHQDGDSNILANPRIRVKNHEKADIHIGDKLPVITNTTTSTGIVSQSISYMDVGLKLDVEPTIYLDNEVGIKVGLEVSSITKQIQNKDGSLTYQIGTRNANTVLRLKDGETQILAGLINKQDQKTANSVPGLGQLPIIGRLFSSHSDTASKTEVVLLITPRVVRNIIPPASPVEEFSSGTESDIGLDQMEINHAEADKGSMVAMAEPTEVPASDTPANDMQAKPEAPLPPPLGNVKLALDAPPQVQVGKEFTVRLNLAAEGLQNAMLNLSFDPSKLKIINVAEGDLLKKPDGKTQFLQQVQDRAGRINLSVIRQGNVQGEGQLASVTFQPLAGATGSAQLRVDAANFSDASGRVLPINALPMATVVIAK